MREHKMGDAPVFVKIEDYKEVLDILDHIKDRLEEAKRILGDINELKIDEGLGEDAVYRLL